MIAQAGPYHHAGQRTERAGELVNALRTADGVIVATIPIPQCARYALNGSTLRGAVAMRGRLVGGQHRSRRFSPRRGARHTLGSPAVIGSFPVVRSNCTEGQGLAHCCRRTKPREGPFSVGTWTWLLDRRMSMAGQTFDAPRTAKADVVPEVGGRPLRGNFRLSHA